MRNMKRPDSSPIRPTVPQPQMPNQYTNPYGTPPKDHAPAPFWYMKSQQNEGYPMHQSALLKAFQGAAKPMQGRVNRQRRPSDAMRGY